MQFVYAQTLENEIIENTLERVDNTTTASISEITESLTNASESTEHSNTTTYDTSKHRSRTFKKIEKGTDLLKHSKLKTQKIKTTSKKTGEIVSKIISIQEFYPKFSKHIIDKIDDV